MSLRTFQRAYPKVTLSAADQAKMAALPPWLLSLLLALIKFFAGNLDAILAMLAQFGITLSPATIALLKWLIYILVKPPAPGPQPA